MITKRTVLAPAGKRQGRWQWRLFGLTLGIFLAVLTTRQTGWIVRTHVTAPLSPLAAPGENSYSGSSGPREEAMWQRGAERVSDDVGAQIAYTFHHVAASYAVPVGEMPSLNEPASEQKGDTSEATASALREYMQGIRRIIQRFPNNPVPYAISLQYSLENAVHIQRPELKFDQNSFRFDPAANNDGVNMQGALAEYLRIAREGERLDPVNAYFPMMQAVGDLALSRDQEALQDLDRASRKSQWNDYRAEEIQGAWALRNATYGQQSAGSLFTILLTQPIPQYRALLDAYKVFVWQAVLQESHGHEMEGIAIRGRLMRVAEKMLSEVRDRMGYIYTSNMFDTSIRYPGGKKTGYADHSEQVQDYQGLHQQIYASYLQSHHAVDEENYFLSLYTQERFLDQRFPQVNENIDQPWDREYPTWLTGYMFPAEIILFALLAAAAGIYGHQRRFVPQPIQPQHRSTLFGLATGFGVFLATGLITVLLSQLGIPEILSLCLPLLAMLTLVCLRHFTMADRRMLFTALMTTLSLFALLGLLCGLTYGANMFLFGRYVGYSPADALTPFRLALILSGIVLILPTALCYLVVVIARVRQQPVIAGGLNAFQRMALPILSLLLLSYVGCILFTARMDAENKAILVASTDGNQDAGKSVNARE
ncbi:MAG TPA: hypothetical protein VKU00_20340 [Chthonomonadaceae bacterium]|nr:hypothetical protein [Chthonomonadaceae bacterium]